MNDHNSIVQVFPGKDQVLPVMALQAEQTVSHGIIALLLQQGDSEEIALGFTHLTGLIIEVHNMEPVVAPLVTDKGLGLCNLVGMVRECIINTAAVDIQIFTQVLHRNAGALNVPTGIANTPRGNPLQCLVFKLGLGKPQNEVVLVTLVGIFFHAVTYTGIQIIGIMVVKDIILL